MKATKLHKVECKATYTGCYNAGFTGSNNIITYGTIVNGNPKPGDAYDCDVNNDGTYDEQIERFYYVGSEGANSVLIYYTNVNDQATYVYDSSNENWHGPRTGYHYLPSTSEWDNPRIIAPGTRQIVDKDGKASTVGGTIEEFTYTNKAVRLLTAQELVNACPSISVIGNVAEGELDGCNWFMENVGRYENYANENVGSSGYWLETPRSNVSDSIYDIWGNKRRVYDNNSSTNQSLGIRPVITVKTSDLG